MSRSQRRKTAWSIGPGGTGVTIVSTSSASFLGGGAQPIIDGLTVVRIRGELLIYLTLGTSTGDAFSGAVGIGDVALPAFTAGIASVPTPITEETDENWLWHSYFTVAAHNATETAFNESAVLRLPIDSKAMRKQGVDRVLYAAIEVVEIGAATLHAFLNCRVLDKLP